MSLLGLELSHSVGAVSACVALLAGALARGSVALAVEAASADVGRREGRLSEADRRKTGPLAHSIDSKYELS